jgi:hypothetical protein
MSSSAPPAALSPTQAPSVASVATTSRTAASSSPTTNQASTASPPVGSAPSSVSSPQFSPPHAVAAAFNQHPAPAQPGGPARQPLQPGLPSPSSERQVAEARDAVVASISNMLDGELQSRAALLHSNNAAIEKQFRDVERALSGLRREDDRLARVADDAARRVKELGNVQNWAELLEKDFLQLEETLRLVREGSTDSGSWSGSGSYSGSYSGSEAGEAVEGRDADGDVAMEDNTTASTGEVVVEPPVDKGKAKADVARESMDVDEPPNATPAVEGEGAEASTTSTIDTSVEPEPSHAATGQIPAAAASGQKLAEVSTAQDIRLETKLDRTAEEELNAAAAVRLPETPT